MTLEYNKVLLRAISMEHVTDKYLSWLNDDEVTKGIVTSPGEYTFEMLQEYVRNVVADKSTMMFAVTDKTSGDHIGNIKIYDLHPVNKTCGLALMLGDKSYWGKGYGTDACQALIDHAFDTLFFQKIWLVCFRENTAAKALYEKLGFHVEGLLEKHVYSGGKFIDEYFMALFRENRKT